MFVESCEPLLTPVIPNDSTTDSCWPDKIAFDEARAPTEFFAELGVFRTIMKLHDFDTKLPSYRDFGRRLYLIFVEEVPDEDTLFDMATLIADHINRSSEIDEKQTILPPERNNFIMALDKPFVEVLGNRQTYHLAEDILSKDNLKTYFSEHPDVVPALWSHGSMDVNVARRLELPLEFVRPSNLDNI